MSPSSSVLQAKPHRPARFMVPASNRSGRPCGISRMSDMLPVPPAMIGLVDARKSSVAMNPPTPSGPMKPLWAVNAIADAPRRAKSMSRQGDACAVSMMNSRPFSLAAFAAASRSVTIPVTLDAAVAISALVLSVTREDRPSKRVLPLPSLSSTENSIPYSVSALSTALCSKGVTMT